MKAILRVFLLCCLCLDSSLTLAAEATKTIGYENQRHERFDLENVLKEIIMVKEEVDSTCTKKEPYQENVCKDVVKYKKECATVPAHQECRQVNKPICHNETRYERQCRRLPGREQCRNVEVPDCHYETRYEQECNRTPDRQDCRTTYEQQCHTVPGEQQCRVVTRYRQECSTVPGERQCRTVPGREECRVVTRYRQECSTVPGGQQCRTIPGDVKCEIVNGENRCVKIPPRQECSDRPSRQECRQVPYEERECRQGSPRQECTDGPSRQACRQVPYEERECRQGPSRQECNQVPRQECRTIPGEMQCRQVPRQEQVCRTKTERQCETTPGDEVCENVPSIERVCDDNYENVCENVPAKQECKDVPYTVKECKMETKYKDVQYPCKKTIEVQKEKIVKTYKSTVDVSFNPVTEIEGLEFIFELTKNGKIQEKLNDPERFVVFYGKDVKETDVTNVEKRVDANYNITILDAKGYLNFTKTQALEGHVKKRAVEFRVLGKLDSKRLKLDMKIQKGDKTYVEKSVPNEQVNLTYDAQADQTTISINFGADGVKFGNYLTSRKTEFNVDVTVIQDYSDLMDKGYTSSVKTSVFKWTKSGALKYAK